MLDKSTDPSDLGALYGTPFDIWACCCMIMGMVLGIPCIEIRDERKRGSDLADAAAKVPALRPLLGSMLSEFAEARPTASAVVASLKEIAKRL